MAENAQLLSDPKLLLGVSCHNYTRDSSAALLTAQIPLCIATMAFPRCCAGWIEAAVAGPT